MIGSKTKIYLSYGDKITDLLKVPVRLIDETDDHYNERYAKQLKKILMDAIKMKDAALQVIEENRFHSSVFGFNSIVEFLQDCIIERYETVIFGKDYRSPFELLKKIRRDRGE